MNPEIRYYLSVFVRRLPIFLLVFLSISSASIAVSVILPTKFRADALLLVEPPQIPDRLAATTVQVSAGEQLQIIQRRLTTRANLIEVAREYRVYEDHGLLNPDQIVARMRSDTRLRSNSGRNQATLLTVEFEARSGRIAADVTNEYVTRILADNARLRMRQAEDTLAFFEQEVDRLNTELDLQSARILKFQNDNSGALPDTLSFRMNRASNLQERMSQMTRDRARLEEQRGRIVQIFEQTGIVAGGLNNEPRTFEEEQLVRLRQRLSTARAVYSEESPQVRSLRNQVAALEEQVASQGAGIVADASPAAPVDLSKPENLLELQLGEIDAQLAFMDEQFAELQVELEGLQDTIERTPNNSIELQALRRDYENVQRQYERSLERLSAAVTGERIEVLSKGQRVTVIEQAVAPTDPHSPNRDLIAFGGTALGFGAAMALIILLEVLNKAIRRPIDLTRGLGIQPLATIPYISTPGEKTRRRLVTLMGLLVVILGIPAALYLVHYYYMPLDLLVDRALDKIRSQF